MEKESIKIDFDKENDIISLFREGKKSKFSFDFEFPKGDVVIDFGFNWEVIGLDIFNASQYIPMLKNLKEDL